jgi:phosphatidylserine/phosphatidylglycerophosphate/cardiolipin synthase-like enzyme
VRKATVPPALGTQQSLESQMRTSSVSRDGEFKVKAIAGTNTILLAMDCPEERCAGLRGFAIWRSVGTRGDEGKWLRSQKVFRSIVPDPKALVRGRRQVFTTREHPVQSFLWGDYTAAPSTQYQFEVVPMYGQPGALEPHDPGAVSISVTTEPEDQPNGHGVWFNRGAIASQAFAREFGDIKPSTQQLDDLTRPVTKWLSRGLAEACIRFIDDAQPGDGLSACVYELTYRPVLNAFKSAIDRGVDVKISFHDTAANAKAIAEAELPAKARGKKVLFKRSVPKIPHNKFIVHLSNDKPVAVWTGSTNITSSGFLGQSNVGHLVRDAAVARKYLDYWQAIAADPALDKARQAAKKVSPHPAECVPPNSTTTVFSPRYTSAMLDWYGNRMHDAGGSLMFTAAFGVNQKLVGPIAEERDFLRFVLMEKRPKREEEAALRKDRDVVISYGATLGEVAFFRDGKRQTRRIQQFELDKWFLREEHFRKAGNIFFVHTKFLLVDPLSADPLVCTGSANFSDNSLTQNDENMLLIRGDTRVADIYLTEFDRIFRHFYFRDVANEIALKGKRARGAFLDEKDAGPLHWTRSYFRRGALKTRRREMFFAEGVPSWAERALERAQDETAKHGDTPRTAKRKKAAKKAARASPRSAKARSAKKKAQTRSRSARTRAGA